jgi:hypothetical protein
MSPPNPFTYALEAYDAYVTCALWSTTCEDADGDVVAMDSLYEPDDIAPDSQSVMWRDVIDFVTGNFDDIADIPEHVAGRYPDNAGAVGHDLWLTRNRHGAGFWERGLGVIGQRLTEAAHAMGPVDLYVGDDRRVHVS